MQRTLALLHTSPVLVPTFADLANRYLEGVKVFHMVDESLIKNTIQEGRLTKPTVRRVAAHVESAFQAGADAVLVTCSSIGPSVGVARQLFDGPVMRIDERMAERAVESGGRIGVIATLETTLAPTVELVQSTAGRLGHAPRIVARLCEGAFAAVLRGDTPSHDQAVTAALIDLSREVDVIVLAQASMARVVGQLAPEHARAPILASPPLAMEQAREVLASLAR